MSDFEEEISGIKHDEPPFRDRDLEAMKYALASRSGRRLVYSLLGVCHFGRSAFGGTNEVTNFLTGKQSVGEYIMGLLNMTSPEAFSLMVKEAKEDEDNDRRTNDDDTGSNSDAAFARPDTGGNQPS